jgi:hypothetical protein
VSRRVIVVLIFAFGISAGVVRAQAQTQTPVRTQSQAQARLENDQARMSSRQIVIMEEVLQRAVKFGAESLIERLRPITVHAQGALIGAPDVSGYRLEGFGMFFAVRVPTLSGAFVLALPLVVAEKPNRAPGPGPAIGVFAPSAPPPAAPLITMDDSELVAKLPMAYREAVTQSLISAMLDNSGGLGIPADEWLVVAARRETQTDPLNASGGVRTTYLMVKGRDLGAYHQKRIDLSEALKLVTQREE